MPFELMQLPFARDALEPHMSAKTIDFHYGKHHKTYVDTLNKLIEGTEQANMSLEEIIEDTYENPNKQKIFNNAAQVWNHNFFWNSMKPGGGSKPTGDLGLQIDSAFGSLDGFKKSFSEAATGQFGSGWAWLVLDNGALTITKTANAVNPMSVGQKALLTCDVWEHAYYLDYQNRRADMVTTFLNHLVNWDFAAQNLDMVSKYQAA